MSSAFQASRRRLLQVSLVTASGAALLGPALLAPTRANASDLPKLAEDDTVAKQLHYVHDAAASTVRKNDSEFCHNCLYFKGSADTEWAGCTIFPGKAVNAEGWCNVWGKKG